MAISKKKPKEANKSKLQQLIDKGVDLQLKAVYPPDLDPSPNPKQLKWLENNQEELISELIVKRNQARFRDELASEPLTLDQINIALEMVKEGDLSMKCYLGRWVNNPTLYQNKVVELLDQRDRK